MGASLRKSMIMAAAVLIGAAGLPVRAAEPTAAGLWEQVDDNTGRPESWFKITERNGLYVGNLVKIFFKPGEDENWVCDRCEGAEKGAPVLGLALIKGMRRNGYSYENGTIMDPRDGSVYRALMRLSPDGNKLEVRGYLGISLFGRSQTWNRLPTMRSALRARARRRRARPRRRRNSPFSLRRRGHPKSVTPASPSSAPTASAVPVAVQASAVIGAPAPLRAKTSAPSSIRTSRTRPSA